jgi:hypothetical protein
MKKILTTLFLLFSINSFSQKIENIIIITTDGFRWQEVFNGMDSSIANNAKYNQEDSAVIFKKYWAATEIERRKKLLPFLWSMIEQKGQIYGNRKYGNKVDVANPYWFSYPGYNEIFTGYADTLVNSNEYKPNPNTNMLDFVNRQPAYKNKVAAFGAWHAFERILNREKTGLMVVNAFDKMDVKKASANEILLNKMLQDSYKPFGEAECLDVFTHFAAKEYLQQKKPKLLYIAYGETDEWAHEGRYRNYLNAAHQVDKWINELWNFVQSNATYKNKTAIFITTDHGRGDVVKQEWTSHNNKIVGANEIWFAVIGPNILPKGEVKIAQQFYQKQFAQTLRQLININFRCEHPVAEKINLNGD